MMGAEPAIINKMLDKVVGVWYFGMIEVLLGLMILIDISTGLTYI